MKQNCLVFAFTALAFGCTSLPDPNPDLGGPPQSFAEYAASTEENSVTAEAYFDPNYRDLFGVDLLQQGIIAIHLEARALSELAKLGKVQLLQGSWEPRLYLQDGTALLAMDIEELKEVSSKAYKAASQNRFSAGNLIEGIEGYLFFRATPKQAFRFRDHTITHSRGKTTRAMDLYHSLLSFNVSIDNEPHPFYVGVKPQ